MNSFATTHLRLKKSKSRANEFICDDEFAVKKEQIPSK